MSNRRSIARLIRVIMIVSVVGSLAAALMTGGGCGKGLFPEVTSSGTATATPVTNAFFYASNFNDGTVSAFARNTNTGALTFISKRSAGAIKGPVGLAVENQNAFAYVANAADGNVYEYAIVQGGAGTLGDLSSIGNIPSGNTPQIVAIDSNAFFVYVTNAVSKTVSEYGINTDGTLTSIGTVTGLFTGKPFGITAHPSAQFVYVSDNTAGLIYAFSIGSNGVLTSLGSPANSNGGSRGQPGEMAIAVDASQAYLFVDDVALSVVSVFLIQSNGTLVFGGTFGTSSTSKPIGIDVANNNGNSYVLTANMMGNFVQPFLRTQATLTPQTSVTDNNGPTGLVVDPAGLFAYTGNSGNGTIALLGINNAQCGAKPFCLLRTFASESPANSSAGTQFVATTH